jgi:hypothetical protein
MYSLINVNYKVKRSRKKREKKREKREERIEGERKDTNTNT